VKNADSTAALGLAEPTSPADSTPGGATAGAVSALLGELTIRSMPDGRLSIEAPPHAASALASMLRTVASMLETGGR
jgi:hypothetical protein